ncbi:MAG: hypothetical protein II024_03620, partial [Firmicutes bacterium]|nr:hypothetical protein [Bacillota bacterium]
SWIIVDVIYAPNPEELKLVPKDCGYDEYKRAMKRVQYAKDLGKKIIYPTPGKRVGHWVGKIRVWMWRRKANPADYVDYQVNNTSMQVYFPDLEFLAPGDAITTTEKFFDFIDQDKNDWPITGFLINHHGNGIGNAAPLYQKHGAKICWYSDWEPKGVGIGGTCFSKYGAGKCKPLFWTLRPFKDLHILADGEGHVTWSQGDKSYTFDISYGASPKKEVTVSDPKNSPGENSPKLRDMSTLFGVDVGYSQGRINWDKLAPHIDFAIIECGYGQNRIDQDDAQWKRNTSECERLGIPYTLYLYSYAGTAGKATGEADHILRIADGLQISLPLYYDIEESACKPVAAAIMDVWANKVEKAGYWAGVYTGEYYWNSSNLKGTERYTKWIAKYGANNGKVGNPPNVPNVDIWQYSSKGSLPGVNSEGLDINIMYRDLIKDVTGKDYVQAARDVWAGKYGGGEERIEKLTAEGFDARIVQHFVNRMKA